MKLISILDRLAAVPAPAATPRRALLQQLGRAAVAALPLTAALPAVANTQDTAYDALTQLLLLERLQLALYTRALAAPGLIPTAQTANFQRLRTHQEQQTAFLTQAWQNAGSLVPPLPTFDLSGRRGVATNPELFPGLLSDYDAFLALAQQLEDLGTRLYLTHAFAPVNDLQLVSALLRLQAVEAQHSAHVRGLRRGRGAVVATWPSDDDAVITRPAAAQVLTAAATGGEGNILQYLTPGRPIVFSDFLLIRDNTAIRDSSLPEAFDEPVSSATAQAALTLFA